MKCYFVFDEFSQKKILIPGCYQSLYREDLAHCICYQKAKSPRFISTELADLKAQIKHLTQELNAHIRIIEKLTKKK